MRTLSETEINIRNQGLASYEKIKQLPLVPKSIIENQTLTPALKVESNVAMKQCKERIETMHTEQSLFLKTLGK